MPRVTAFVARSFAEEDYLKIKPVLDFVDSFRNAGFISRTAERAEVESVSVKVRKLIDSCDVFIGIFTKRYPVYDLDGSLGEAFDVLRRRLKPIRWTAPAWVLQESGYALKAGKLLILLRETDVEVSGLQGDLEYIPFIPEDTADLFQKLSEMISGVLGSAGGLEVETIVRQTESVANPELPKDEERQRDEVFGERPLAAEFVRMFKALEEKDFAGALSAYETGLKLIESGSEKMDPLLWQCFYLRETYRAGDRVSLDKLRELSRTFPDRPEPLSAIGFCFSEFGEHGQAADFLEKAGSVAQEKDRAQYVIHAVKELRQLKKLREAKELLLRTLKEGKENEDANLLSSLSEILKEMGQTYFAFGLRELVLHRNPAQQGVRFELGLDYRSADLNNLFLLHFRSICDHDAKNAAALHNLGLAYSDCGLNVASVSKYKETIQLGGTLAAANLGYKYLDAGMAEEAQKVLQAAAEKPEHDDEVDRCISDIARRTKTESEKVKSLLEAAGAHREFFIELGASALRTAPAVAVDGAWRFADAPIEIKLEGGSLRGEGKRESRLSRFAVLAGGAGGAKKEEILSLKGSLLGAACEFELEVRDPTDPFYGLMGSTSTRTRKGYLAFSEDGRTAHVLELKGSSPGTPYVIRKLDSVTVAIAPPNL